MKHVGDRGEIGSGMGGLFTVIITAEADADGHCMVKIDNKQTDFHGQVLRVKYDDIRPPAELVPLETLSRLRRNWTTGDTEDHVPALKLAARASGAVWLLTELKDDLDIAFGLCDLGQGFPELGYVSLFELSRVNLGVIAPIVKRDPYFFAEASLSVFAEAARMAEAITFDRLALKAAYDSVLAVRLKDGRPKPWVWPDVG